MKSNLALMALTPLLLAAATAHSAQTFSGRLDDPGNGALVGSDLLAPVFTTDYDVANNVALYGFSVMLAGPVTIVSTGFGSGGVDPYFTLFAGADSTATVLDSNYTQAFSVGGDFSWSGVLGVGSYQIALGAFANMTFAENYGLGTLADGFTGFGAPGSLGDSHYTLLVTTPVPEPAAGLAMMGGLGLLWLRRAALRCVPPQGPEGSAQA